MEPPFRPPSSREDEPDQQGRSADHGEFDPEPGHAQRPLSGSSKFALTVFGSLGLLAILLVVAALIALAFLAYLVAGSSQGTGDQATPLAEFVTFSRCESALPGPTGHVFMEFTNPDDGAELASIAIRTVVESPAGGELYNDTWIFRGVGPGETVSASAEFPVGGEDPEQLSCEVGWVTVNNG